MEIVSSRRRLHLAHLSVVAMQRVSCWQAGGWRTTTTEDRQGIASCGKPIGMQGLIIAKGRDVRAAEGEASGIPLAQQTPSSARRADGAPGVVGPEE